MTLIPRAVLPQLLRHKPPKAVLLYGPRRAGKTTLLREIGKDKDVTWFDGDNPDDVNIGLNLPSGASVRTLLLNNNAIAIDEAQRVPGIGLLIKRLVDANTLLEKPVDIYATGSSSLDLASGVRESALGRIVEVNVWPFSTAELAESSSWGKVLQDIETRIVFGMYPEICVDPENAKANLINHCTALFFKDIFELGGIRYSSKFEILVKHLAYNIGNVVNYDALSRECGLSRTTVVDYIRLLEHCFVVKTCSSYARNLSNELRKSKKIYFCDTGIRNAILKKFEPLTTRADAGALWENFFFMERVKYHSLRQDFADIYFWRTAGQAAREIDFVEVVDGRMQAFECKLSPKAKVKPTLTFTRAYPECPVEIVTPQELYKVWQNGQDHRN